VEKSKLAQLDHAVINTRFEMDRAEQIFQSLGFFLTERGYHSLGSINHLMIFGSDYLELIGLPPGKENLRPQIAEAPLGLHGMVFKTTDVDENHEILRALDFAADPPKTFTRPVKLPEGEFPAKFRTVDVKTGVFPGGRVYFCEHGTPHLLWRPEWQKQTNGVTGIREIVVVSQAFEEEAENLAKILQSEVSGDSSGFCVALVGAKISLMPPLSYEERYRHLASPLAGRTSVFAALVLQTDGLKAIRQVLANRTNRIPVIDETDRVVIHEPIFNCLMEFIE